MRAAPALLEQPNMRKIRTRARRLVVVLGALLAVPGVPASASAQEASGSGEPSKIPNDQLDSLVAPIALYPDPLLAQTLAASTYPLELVQLQQWLTQHQDLKDQALVDAVAGQDWDPSVQSMAALPDVTKRLVDNIKWTTDLGNAFLAQESEVMDAVQRMRAKAANTGTLTSSEQMKVENKIVDSQPVIVIEQSSPQTIYVPSYDPAVVYGAPAYPYPAIAYPAGGLVAGAAISFGVGVAMGAAFHGGWRYGAGWGHGHNSVNINNNNNFVRNQGNRGGNTVGSGNWQHNPKHRGGAPYGDKASADRFGGGTRNGNQRQANARQSTPRSEGGASRGTAGGGRQDAASRTNAGNADRIGNRTAPSGSGRSGGAFSDGGGRGTNGGAASRSSSRGGASTGGASRGGGGGGSRAGGGRGRGGRR
jgi:hypothetical protein